MKKFLIFILVLLAVNSAYSQILVIDDFESGIDDWKLNVDHGADFEVSGLSWNGSNSLHYSNYIDYGDRIEKNYSISANNLENYIVSLWFYSNNSYTNIDIYMIDDNGVECSNSINIGYPTGSWYYFRKRLGDFEKCDYQSLTSIDRIQFYIGEIPADIYIDDLLIETSDLPLPDNGEEPEYEKGTIVFQYFFSDKDSVKRGESVLFECRVICETGCSNVILNSNSQYIMQRVSGTSIDGIYRYSWLTGPSTDGEYQCDVIAYDLGGNSTLSDNENVFVNSYLILETLISSSVELGELLWINGSVYDSYGNKTSATLNIDIGSYDSISRSTDGDFSIYYNTSNLDIGVLDISIKANDFGNNTGYNSSQILVLTSEQNPMKIIIESPNINEFYRGQNMAISFYVVVNDTPITDATVNATFGGDNIYLSQNGIYNIGDYLIPWDTDLGNKDLLISASKDDLSALNGTIIQIVEEEFQTDFEGIEDVFVGFGSTITLNLSFLDDSPVINGSIIGKIGNKSITFIEVSPGVYSAEYIPDENDTTMTITNHGKEIGIIEFDLKLAGLIDYLRFYWFYIVVMAAGITPLLIIIRKKLRS